MKYLLILLITTTIIFAKDNSFTDDISMQGHVDLTIQSYLIAPSKKHSQNLSTSAEFELDYKKDDFQAKTKIKAQLDYYDLQTKEKQTDRSFVELQELLIKYDFEDDEIMFGKSVRFWGALEVRNITDNFNSDDLRSDPFQTNKLGAWNASYTHYTDNGEFSIIAKLYEQSREMSAYPYVYYYFPQNINILPNIDVPLYYDSNLNTQSSRYRPSIYLKYSASTDTEYPLDYCVIFENGYDSQRYHTTTLNSDLNSMSTNENAYLVNKLITYNTLVVGSTLVKLEAVYADVIDDKEISDYYHLGLGIEHTLSQIYDQADLGLIVEYYKYETLENDKRNDLELFEVFQNDLFLGIRYSFNDGDDSSIVAGAILDLDYDEQVYYLEYETRIAEMFKLNFDYRYIKPSENYKTAFNLMTKHERISLKIGYYF